METWEYKAQRGYNNLKSKDVHMAKLDNDA